MGGVGEIIPGGNVGPCDSVYVRYYGSEGSSIRFKVIDSRFTFPTHLEDLSEGFFLHRLEKGEGDEKEKGRPYVYSSDLVVSGGTSDSVERLLPVAIVSSVMGSTRGWRPYKNKTKLKIHFLCVSGYIKFNDNKPPNNNDSRLGFGLCVSCCGSNF